MAPDGEAFRFLRVPAMTVSVGASLASAFGHPISAQVPTYFLTVHGSHPKTTEAPTVREQAAPPPEWSLGPVTISGGPVEEPGRSSIQLTAALPIAAIPGLNAVVNASGGRDATTRGGVVSAAAVTAGVQLHF